MRGRSALRMASHALSMSFLLARASPQMTGGGAAWPNLSTCGSLAHSLGDQSNAFKVARRRGWESRPP